MTTERELHIALDKARASLSGMMCHSCVADSAPEDKDGEDHVAESNALATIRMLDGVINPKFLSEDEPKS